MSNNPPYSYTSLRNTPYILNYLYEGQVYAVYHEFVNASGTINVQITTGSRIAHLFHTSVQAAGGGDVTVSMYEGATFTTGTVPPNMPPRGFDRRVGNLVPSLTTFFIDPTAVNIGAATLISRIKLYSLGGSQGGNDITIDNLERVLVPNTTYIMQIEITGSSVDIVVNVQYYESGN